MNNEFFKDEIHKVLDDIFDTLVEKNESYGFSALDPIAIFAGGHAIESIQIRIDDKLARIKSKTAMFNDEDTIKDLQGYLVLLRIAQKMAVDKDYKSEILNQGEVNGTSNEKSEGEH